jgi:hypothetical protein
MGEIMRWRLSRGAQRRIPAPESIVTLDTVSPITAGAKAKIDSAAADNPEFASLFKNITDAIAQRQPLPPAAGGAPSTPLPLVKALMALDEWLASFENRPAVSELNAEITTLLGPYLPPSPAWQSLYSDLTGALYMMLLGNAFGLTGATYSSSYLSLATRWLLVIALVDTLQQTPTSIQTPDQVYDALRWRTLVLPQAVVKKLSEIQALRRAVLVRKPGFADLYITREEWDHYEPAEIASIENILGRELKSRVHILVNQTQTTSTTETTTTSLKEQDTTTTDLSQLQLQSSSDISLAAHLDGQVDTSGLYGPTQVNTHIGGSLDYSTHDTTSRAATQSHETVSRAVSRIEQSTRQVRTVSTLTRATDKEKHEFDNRQQPAPVVGIYRWVDQIQNVELDRYPHRFLMEFEIPEPGAWTRWLHLNDASRNMVNQLPIPLTLYGTAGDPPLQANMLDQTTYSTIAARYKTAGITAYPEQMIIAHNLTFPASGATLGLQEVHADSGFAIPNGYYAAGGIATSICYGQSESHTVDDGSGGTVTTVYPEELDVALGAGIPRKVVTFPRAQTALATAGAVQGPLPIEVGSQSIQAYTMTVEVTCLPTPQTIEQWQNDTYALIASAYISMLQAYNDEKAGMTIQQTNLVDAKSPEENTRTVRQELKRQIISMLLSTPTTQFGGRGAIVWDSTGQNFPSIIPSTAVNVAPEIQFLEQAFEWETMSYICYPLYWADYSRWPELSLIDGNDQDFADFLRAGSARVVLAARPGFEDQINFYIQFGIMWGGGPMPAPGDPEYLSIADEIKAQQQRPQDVTVIDAWQVRLPTTLIWLQNPDGLPKNPSPTITYPFGSPSRLTAVSASSTQINLSWSPANLLSGTISNYLVERSQGAGSTNFAQIGTSNSTTYSDSGITSGSTYCYRVRAQDNSNNLGPYSAVVTVTAP